MEQSEFLSITDICYFTKKVLKFLLSQTFLYVSLLPCLYTLLRKTKRGPRKDWRTHIYSSFIPNCQKLGVAPVPIVWWTLNRSSPNTTKTFHATAWHTSEALRWAEDAFLKKARLQEIRSANTRAKGETFCKRWQTHYLDWGGSSANVYVCQNAEHTEEQRTFVATKHDIWEI